MKPSGQPVLPNGGSKIHPGQFLLFALGAFTCIAFPPLLSVALPALAIFVGIKIGKRAGRRHRDRQRLDAYAAYHERWQVEQIRQQAENMPVTNPGWRL